MRASWRSSSLVLGVLLLVAAQRLACARPMTFIENLGQVDPAACLHVHGSVVSFAFTADGVLIAPRGASRVVLRFEGARPRTSPEGADVLPGFANFYLGDDPLRWRTRVPTFASAVYRDVYPGIDVVYSGEDGRLKTTYLLASGARARAIRLTYDGVLRTALRADGALVLTTPTGELVEQRPTAWQESGGIRVPVACAFKRLGGNRVGFEVGSHDRSLPLVIDPVLDYSTYLGGSDADEATAVSHERGGSANLRNAIVSGTTGSVDFPVLFPAQPSPAGQRDLFAARLDDSGEQVLWATYLGGSGDDVSTTSSIGWGFAGWTTSSDFPGDRFGPRGGRDALLATVHPEDGRVTYGATFGGSGDDVVNGTAGGLVVGTTSSPDFPLDGVVLDATLDGPTDAFVGAVQTPGSLTLFAWSSFIGGSGDEDGLESWHRYSAAPTDPRDGHVLVVGSTRSADFTTTSDALDRSLDGPSDGFLVRFRADCAPFPPCNFSFDYATFIGGRGDDRLVSVTIGQTATGIPLLELAGTTSSDDLPTRLPFQANLAGGRDAFYQAYRFDTRPRELEMGTYLGGAADDEARLFTSFESVPAGDPRNPSNRYLIGWTESADFPVNRAAQAVLGGGRDGFYAALQPRPNAMALVESTFLGGTGDDEVHALAFDDDGCKLLAGRTTSADFPTVGAAQPEYGGGDSDAFIARLCDQRLPPSGEVDLTWLSSRLDDIDAALVFAEAKLDTIGADLDDPPTHADLARGIDANGDAIAAVEVKLDAMPDLSRLEPKIDALEAKLDLLAAEAADARLAREEERSAREEARSREIEQLLHHMECIPSLWLPAIEGGDQELARDVVADRIVRAERSGDPFANVRVARQQLAAADEAIADGKHVKACQHLSDSLRALTLP